MAHCAIVGINWGDEGKGRMVDYLAESYDVVIRYQGGNNAGHTVVNELGEFKLHLLPSGIFRPEKINLLGAGTVIDLEQLCAEMDDVRAGGVSITPEDVYCCGFATPLMIKPGTEKAEELSVSAARGGEYAYDTPGEEWVSDAEGELDPQAQVYGGIRNYLLRYDMISLLPPGQWGFTCYGSTVYLDDEAAVSVDEMLEELKVLSPVKYEAAQETGDPRTFAWKTYDLVNLEAVDSDTVPAEGTEGFLKGRVEGLIYHVPTNEIYADGTWQEALTALASVYGMLMNNFGNIKDDYLPRLAEPIGYMYFAYAAERLIEEGRAADEAEAAAIAAEDLIETLTGTRPDEAITVDDFFGILARFIADNEDSPLAEKLYSNVDGLVSSAAGMVLRMGIAPYTKSEESKDASMSDLVKNFVKACAYGPDPESPAAKSFTDAQSVRKIFYGLSSFIFSSFAPEVSEAFGRNEANVTDGSGSFRGLVQALYENFRVAERKNGEIVRTYESFAEAADETLAEIFVDILADPLAQAEELYGQEYRAAAEASVDTMVKDIDDVREILSYVLFYVEGEEFSADAVLRNVYTYVENVDIVMQAHNYEIYTSWAKAADRKYGEEH